MKTTNTTETTAKQAVKMESMKKDLLSLEKSYLSDVKKYINADLKNASNHIETLKAIIKELHFNRVTSNGIALIKEEYLKAYKQDANQTFKKFSMRYGWLLIASVQEVIKSETNIALIDPLNQTDLENYIKPVVTRGGGRVASDKEETKEGTKETLEGTKETLEGTKETLEGTKETLEGTKETLEGTKETLEGTKETLEGTKETLEGTKETLEGTKETLEGTKELSNGILESLNILLSLDSDSILFKISKLSNEDLKALNVALKLLA